MRKYDLIVIGAGPAGLFASINAAACNLSVLLLEKKDRPGRKLLISGSGKCNLTHTGTPDELLSHYNGEDMHLIIKTLSNISTKWEFQLL